MKTLIKSSFLLLLGALSFTNLKAQSVDDIVNKNIEALGGKTVVSGVNSLVIESTVEVMGNEANGTTYILNGKGYKSEIDFGGQMVVNCVTDKGGWMINPLMGQTTAKAIPEDQLKASQGQLQVGGPLFNYAAKGNKVELVSKDTADYKLKLTTPDGLVVTYFINTKTYLADKVINRVSVQGQEIETTINFSNYKKTDYGFVMPYTQEVNTPQYTITITNKKIDVNKSIDPAIFVMPK